MECWKHRNSERLIVEATLALMNELRRFPLTEKYFGKLFAEARRNATIY
jgi:hypothetical protein